MLKTTGAHSSCSAAFKNPDGSTVLVTVNPYNNEKVLTIEDKNNILKPISFNAIIL